MTEPMWTPSPERIAAANLTRFATQIEGAGHGRFADYDTLWSWSVAEIENFWSEFWDFSGIIGTKGDTVLDNHKKLTDARFFPDAKINFAQNMLGRDYVGPALISHSETGTRTQWSWQELRDTVSCLQQALSAAGVGRGDRVAGLVPNTSYTVAFCLATASLGAVWCACSPDFGASAAADRLGQVAPKLLICADGYTYNGKHISSLPSAAALAERLPSVEKTIIFPFAATQTAEDIGADAMRVEDFIEPFTARPLEYTQVAFGDPLFIMFSSGTTGLPKCIVHSVGGTLLQHFKEHQLQADIKPGDRLMFYTTCGWMMWNWTISALGSGACLVLYDGSPFHSTPARLADIAAQDKVTHFGTSPKYLEATARAGLRPAMTHDLDALRVILCTGSPLLEQGFDHVYDDWKRDVCLASIAGGTDILGCFVGASPISPVFSGTCQKRHLAMDVRVFDDAGQALTEGQGELVCCAPHPSMPIGFWNDADGARYRAAYFERFENVWHQGDLVGITQNNGVRFFGRSDAVLNPGGVRIGTAEIYRIVDQFDEVSESVVIGQQVEGDQRIVLFVLLADGDDLDDELRNKIKARIKTDATPRHVPSIILAVADIPRTRSGKVAETTVRDMVHGITPKNLGSLANPQAVDLYENLPELRT